MRSRYRNQKRNRRGVAVVCALVCMVIAAAVFAMILRQVGLSRRVVGEAQQQRQATWLVESGIERAVARLATDPEYNGETWNLTAENLGGRNSEEGELDGDSGVVTIEIETVPEQPNRRAVHVRADYPDHPHHRARREKQVTIDLKPR